MGSSEICRDSLGICKRYLLDCAEDLEVTFEHMKGTLQEYARDFQDYDWDN